VRGPLQNLLKTARQNGAAATFSPLFALNQARSAAPKQQWLALLSTGTLIEI
jgi:hypothetical protein